VAVVASTAIVCRELAGRVPQRAAEPPEPFRSPPPPKPPAAGEPLSASHVLAALAERLPRNAVVVEEAPVDRPEIHARLRACEPLGYLSAAMGGLGFAMPAAAGVRMALPSRPVVAVVGDGSAVYGVPVAWSAAHYGIGALFVVLSNERYAVMDRLVERHGAPGPWPAFGEVELATIARGFGCPAQRITTYEELISSLDDVVPTLAERDQPLVLDVLVTPTLDFAP
jgi:benzoylformate decarboxylase